MLISTLCTHIANLNMKIRCAETVGREEKN